MLKRSITEVFKWAIARLWLSCNKKDVSELCRRENIIPIIESNRKTLRKVTRWIDDNLYRTSVFQYGIPDRIKHLIDKEVGEMITYSDVILYFSRLLKQKISYLELGVSVGKNFWQVANFLKDSSLTGFDIEVMNPVLEVFLTKMDSIEWETISGSLKKGRSSLTLYKYEPNQNMMAYLSGDILDENSWRRLSGRKFNLIFSDALHDPKALLFEWEMIERYKLLNEDEFVMIWDDLGGEMTISFIRIWSRIRDRYGPHKPRKLVTQCRGWLGVNEPEHIIGIITSIFQ